MCGGAGGSDPLHGLQALAGRHATQEFVAVGDVELKGLPDPVATVEVVWEPAQTNEEAGGQLPLPPRLVSTSAESIFAFFGRADELARLSDIQKRSAAERRLEVVLISGEPGIGKTTLVAQAARAAHGGGAGILYGNCVEDLGIPYQPWATALGQLVEHADESFLNDFVEANGPALAHLVPALTQRLPYLESASAADADSERFLILEGVVRFLALASATTPFVVVLDNLHWVDAASLQLLSHLVTSSTPMAVTVVGTFRGSDLSRTHPLTAALADLRREPCVDRIELAGLSDLEVIDLLEAAAGHDLPQESLAFAHALRRDTDGNPFFVVEVIRHLAATGGFVQDKDHRWVLSVDVESLALPSSVREVVSHRVARLGDETAKTLSMAAVIGRDFDFEVLSELVDIEENHLLDLLEAAIGAGIITETEDEAERYRFVHALIQQTMYQDLGTARRSRIHLRVAEVLESRTTSDARHVAELARHWMAATRPSNGTKALRYARQAGDQAMAVYAPLDAITWYSQALDLLSRHEGEDLERCALLVALGTAQRHAGESQHRETLLEAARLAQELGDTELLVAAALGGARGSSQATVADVERVEVLRAALSAIGDNDAEHRPLLLVALAEVTDAREWQTCRDLANEAVSLVRNCDERLVVEVLSRSYSVRTQPESSAERMAETAEVVEMADRLGSAIVRYRARYNRVHACVESGHLEEADLRLLEMEAIVDATGLPFDRWQQALSRGWRQLLTGDVAQAELANDEALVLGSQIGAAEALGAWGGVLFEIRLQQGRLGDIAELFADAARENPALDVLRVALTTMRCELVEIDEARALMETDVANGFAAFPRDITWTSAMVLSADNVTDLGHREAAASLYDQLSPFASLIAFNQGDVLGRSLDRWAGWLTSWGDWTRPRHSSHRPWLTTPASRPATGWRAPSWISPTCGSTGATCTTKSRPRP